MIHIERLDRPREFTENPYTGVWSKYYTQSEADFLKSIENLCNSIGADNIISVQFMEREQNSVDCCIITYKVQMEI
jgi:hypothetical protein